MPRLTSTLLVPTLNEIEAVQVIMPQIPRDLIDEIIIVDGGSTDGTLEYMRTNGYKVLVQQGKGYGVGVLQAIHISAGDIIVEFPPDGNSDPKAIIPLIEKIRAGYDLAIGSRYLGNARSEDDDWLTAFGNWMFTKIVNVLFSVKLTDVLVGLRAYRKSTALTLNLDPKGLSWPCQITNRFASIRAKIVEIPVDEPKRIGGERKMMPFRTGWEITTLILRDFWGSFKHKRSLLKEHT